MSSDHSSSADDFFNSFETSTSSKPVIAAASVSTSVNNNNNKTTMTKNKTTTPAAQRRPGPARPPPPPPPPKNKQQQQQQQSSHFQHHQSHAATKNKITSTTTTNNNNNRGVGAATNSNNTQRPRRPSSTTTQTTSNNYSFQQQQQQQQPTLTGSSNTASLHQKPMTQGYHHHHQSSAAQRTSPPLFQQSASTTTTTTTTNRSQHLGTKASGPSSVPNFYGQSGSSAIATTTAAAPTAPAPASNDDWYTSSEANQFIDENDTSTFSLEGTMDSNTTVPTTIPAPSLFVPRATSSSTSLNDLSGTGGGGNWINAVSSSSAMSQYPVSGTPSKAVATTYYNDDSFENEPPLLEELGIHVDHIIQKVKAVVIPSKRFAKQIDPATIVEEVDMAGPTVFGLLLGGELMLVGKLQFGYIYGFGLFGCLAMTLILNLMSPKPVSFWTVASVLGYALLPVNILAAVKIVVVNLAQLATLGKVLAILTILWSTTASTRLLEVGCDMRAQRYLLAYPIALLYSAFVLLTIF